MKKTKIPHRILNKLDKPARYIGEEVNMVKKDINDIHIRFAFCFPDIYEIGMSHLGLQILYHFFNRRSDTYCERVFAPWVDAEEAMRRENISLFALESQQSISQFDFVGFTLQYEMSYTNILNMLDLGNIPLYSRDRGEGHPIICAGGPTAYNPEPLADFIDFFYLGEGEVVWDEILDLYGSMKKNGKSKKDFLEALLDFEGIYVPQFYTVSYHSDGTIQSFVPNHPKARRTIKKYLVKDLNTSYYPENPIIPYIQPVHDRAVLELFRGCIRGCRFCQAGYIYRPVREKDENLLHKQAETLLKNTGHDEISLISLSSSDYRNLDKLTHSLLEQCKKEHINISLPSLRIDKFSVDLMKSLQETRKSSLTFAPEAGTQRLRDVINKGLTGDDIFKGSILAFKGGWNKVKLYFMLGLPTETMEDIQGIADISNQLVQVFFSIPKEERSNFITLTVSTSFFVPKPFTPFQWVAQDSRERFREKYQYLKGQMKRKQIKYNCHDSYLSILEGVIARGDRKIGKVLYEAWRSGCRFDSWSDHFDEEKWTSAFYQAEIDPDFYTIRERSFDENLPWDHIDIGIPKSFFIKEYQRALAHEVTPNCREQCSGCGASSFGEGVCYENPNEIQ